ncbi:kinase-like domain-containing protein [Syncephalis fuscata]|nr:kinase-like domain-containing protein [Syncephalis fuscata]
MTDLEQKIEEVLKKISIEKQVSQSAESIRHKTTSKQAVQQCETTIRESGARIAFLERELQRLNFKKNRAATTGGSSQPPTSFFSNEGPSVGPSQSRTFPSTMGDSPGGFGHNWQGDVSGFESEMNSPHPYEPTDVQYSKLDLRKTEAPLTSGKVLLKMHEVAFKLDIEKKLREGTSKMHQLYQMDQGDKKNRNDAVNELMESTEKIRILNAALRRYQGLYITDMEDDEDDTGDSKEERLNPALRRHVNGRLIARIDYARHLDHAPIRGGRDNETIAVLKIDGAAQAKTRPSRSQRWSEEFELRADKAAEFEVTIYDRVDEQLVPIGMIWMKLSEIIDDLRRANINTGNDQMPGWAPAAEDGSGESLPRANIGHISPDGIECWWDVEPVGQISMRINFIRDAGRKRMTSRLGRQGAVRKRRGEVFEMNGHKFSQQQFYNIMKCAYCSEFLLNGQGVQCEDCKFTCHKKCYPLVVTKCISRAYEEMANKLSHRIHHRFDTVSILAPSWCCHCGYMLPLGKRNVKKCTECSITSHANCSHLVPDFCGMSMSMANSMLREMQAVRRRQRDRPTQGVVAARKSPILPQIMSPTGLSSAILSATPSPTSPTSAPRPGGVSVSGEYSAPVAPDSMGIKPSMPQAHAFPEPQLPSKSPVTSTKKVTLDDFNLLAVLGKGNFGKVMLAEEKQTTNLFAIKMLKKEFIIQNDEVESTKSEKRVFITANQERHPFLVGLHSCFQTDNRIYFVMEYVSGGDLMLHIQRQSFSEQRAKFYACEVLLALEYFHKNNIVYRDLKLDNILLTLDGHIKIADYGLCKESMDFGATTGTFCGTPEFMAPEILLDQRYSRAVDWWAFGVLIYEMLLGQSPFHGDDEEEIFESILEDEVLYPINMSRDSVSILQKLLTRDPTRRLGAGADDALEIKRHPFFRNVDWDAMLQKRIPPPFFPQIKSRTDVSNFDEEFTRERPVLTPTQAVLEPADQAEFIGFSYVATWAGEK